jgi:hypothetical protein
MIQSIPSPSHPLPRLSIYPPCSLFAFFIPCLDREGEKRITKIRRAFFSYSSPISSSHWHDMADYAQRILAHVRKRLFSDCGQRAVPLIDAFLARYTAIPVTDALTVDHLVFLEEERIERQAVHPLMWPFTSK